MGTVAPMLAKRLTSLRYSTSTYLTLAIVGGIVLINSVAWGIPLLVGPQLSQPPAENRNAPLEQRKTLIAQSITSNKSATSKKTKKISVVRHRIEIPLPQKAPATTHVRPRKLQLAGNDADGEIARAPKRLSGVPTTLFPRPEAAPSAPLAVHTEAPNPSDTIKRQPQRSGEIVFASPYTPGVRVSARKTAPVWSHLRGADDAEASTLSTAKAIARRAAQRFEQMRDRIARLDTDASLAANTSGHQTRSVMPVAPRPPRIIDSGGRNISKSASSFVRPRLVRRPLRDGRKVHGHARLTTASLPPTRQTKRKTVQRTASAPKPRTTPQTALKERDKPRSIRRLPRTRAPAIQRSTASSRQRLAALRKRATARQIIDANKKRASILRAKRLERTRKAKRRARRKASAKRVRLARASRTRRRTYRPRRTRRIDGFRRKFHRDLVMANFFSTSR